MDDRREGRVARVASRSDRTEHAVELLAQGNSGGELSVEVWVTHRLVRRDDAGSSGPVGDVVGSAKIVAGERRAGVDRVDEVEHDVVGDELERPAGSAADHPPMLTRSYRSWSVQR